MGTQTPAVLPRTERRIRREARSQTLRDRALALREAGWTLANIGLALGVSTTRAFQLVRKAERLTQESNEGAPARGAPFSSDGPVSAGHNKHEQSKWYTPTTT